MPKRHVRSAVIYPKSVMDVAQPLEFYYQAWFQITTTLILFVIVVLYNRYMIGSRINYYLSLEKEKKAAIDSLRKQMAIDFHDEMGNHLASIITLANSLNYQIEGKNGQAKEIINKIESSSKTLFNGTKEFIWAIDPRSDNLNEVLTYIRDLGVEYFANTPVVFRVEQDFITPETDFPLATGSSRHIVGIFKEVMTNCLRHSKATSAKLSLTGLTPAKFLLGFEDNGCGFDPNQEVNGRGLANIRNRVEAMGGKLGIDSSTYGTRINVEIQAEP